ncbi:MAG: DUF819 family protein [Parvularculaceae bacterium]
MTSIIAPDLVGGYGPDAVWRGMATVAGSWIGGAANQTAIREIFGTGAEAFSIWVAVDVIVANIWLAILLSFAANQTRVDRWLKADVRACSMTSRRGRSLRGAECAHSDAERHDLDSGTWLWGDGLCAFCVRHHHAILKPIS